ncbi:MAG: GatB/YqeY domain-containing protein [Cytophagales bacterium]|nr:MAG: GatB/YqeY domain-containing protein [Cytophagales bacterium]TAF62300.1 MAG: GatB/YqeY domain-containing protein [Cytophagales bacterium]
MTLKEKVESDIKEAMRAKDKVTLEALRSIKSLILLALTQEGKQNDSLSEAEEVALLMKAAKQRKDAAAIFEKENRLDLLQKEQAELAVIEKFLPQMMTDEELSVAIKEIITKLGANSKKEMGKVMGAATKELAGKADNKQISEIIKQQLPD